MTFEEKHNQWLQDEEAYAIAIRCQKLIAKVEKNGTARLPHGRALCVRGLESKIGSARSKKMSCRLAALESDLEEQDRQYQYCSTTNNGTGGAAGSCYYYDDEAIAAAYRAAGATESQLEAECAGNLDRMLVECFENAAATAQRAQQ